MIRGTRLRRAGAAVAGVLALATACGDADGDQRTSAGEDVEDARQAEQDNALPRDGFYTDPAEPGEPGTVVRSEAFEGWETFREETHTARMVYRSLSAEGDPVVSSAALAVPEGETPEEGWPVVAWAHGNNGVAPHCAPSLMKDLRYGGLVQEVVAQGYAVVATDYAGLGAGEGHEFYSAPAHGNDVRYSVAAAREALDGLSDQWAALGHSEGGLAVWSAARQQAEEPVGELVGTLALAPGPPVVDWLRSTEDAPGSGVYGTYLAYGLQVREPETFEPAELLTGAGQEAYEQVARESCHDLGAALHPEATLGGFLQDGWEDDPAVRGFAEDNVYSDRELGSPLFVAAGAGDGEADPDLVEGQYEEQCEHGTAVKYAQVPGGHEEMVEEAAPDAFAWMAGRFAGENAPDDCE